MAQVSKRKLSKETQNELFNQLWEFLSRARDPETAHQLYSDLLTETEKIVLAKRLATALLILRGKTTWQIQAAIKISSSTVSSVSQWLKYTRPKTQKLLIRLSREKDWHSFVDKIEEELDKLPPRYHSDWKKAGQEKYERRKQRLAKSDLR